MADFCRDVSCELILFESKIGESSPVCEDGWNDFSGELVSRKVEFCKEGEGGERGCWEVTREAIVGEVKRDETREVGDGRRDGAGEEVATEVDDGEGGKGGEIEGVQLADQAGLREAELGDAGVGACDAEP